ncbi:MAG: ComEC family competence protein [Elusimicrobiaceae bacterium]|nr:ComEC family competence protein [Elusimicrobiaceae bacterium]
MHPDVYKRPLFLLLVALIIGLTCFYHPAPGKRDVSRFLPQKEVTLAGRVESFAIRKKDKQNVWISVSAVNGYAASGRVYARIDGPAPQWKDTVLLAGKLQVPYGVDLPGNFDWRSYLASKYTFAEMKASQTLVVDRAAWPWRVIRAVRSDILRVFEMSFPEPLSGIASGILLGERGEFSPELYTAFQDSGAVHLLVASGGNVGFVTLMTLAVGVLLGLRRRLLLVVALFTAAGYTLVAGADAPLLRAYLMAASGCVGYFLGRNSGIFQGLVLAGLLILCLSPAAVFETGFQMSFLATVAIVIFLNNYRVPGSWPKAVRFFTQIFLATLASQLALLPVFTNVFYKVSLTGLLSNMVLVPFASFLMGLEFAYYVFSVLHVGILLYYPCLWSLSLFQYLVEFFASFRFSAFSVTAWSAGSVAAYYVVLFWASQLPHKKFARRLFVPCFVLAACSFCWGYWSSSRPVAYLVSEWNKRAVMVRVQKGEALVFNDGISEEKLRRAFCALGLSRVTFAAGFDASSIVLDGLSSLTPRPFVSLWPGEETAVPGGTVRARWELRRASDGHVWEDTGYYNPARSSLSYCVRHRAKEICIGGRGRFVRLSDGRIVDSILNKTVQTAW